MRQWIDQWSSFLIGFLFLLTLCVCCKSSKGPDPEKPIHKADVYPAWSLDGSKIAYLSAFDSTGAIALGLYLTDSLGLFKVPAGAPGGIVRWLPGDSELIVLTYGFQFVKFNLHSKIAVDLGFSAEVGIFDISNDSKYIYFSSQKTDSIWSSSIHRYSLDSGTSIPIISGEQPAISKDGTKLAFHRGGLYLLNLEDTTLIQLATKGTYPAWTPNGQYVFYNDGRGRIYRSDMKGSSIFIADGSEIMSVSPDGTRLLFSGPSPDGWIRIWQCDINGENMKQVTHHPAPPP